MEDAAMNDTTANAILEKSRRLLLVSRNLLRVLTNRLDAARLAPVRTRSSASQTMGRSAPK